MSIKRLHHLRNGVEEPRSGFSVLYVYEAVLVPPEFTGESDAGVFDRDTLDELQSQLPVQTKLRGPEVQDDFLSKEDNVVSA